MDEKKLSFLLNELSLAYPAHLTARAGHTHGAESVSTGALGQILVEIYDTGEEEVYYKALDLMETKPGEEFNPQTIRQRLQEFADTFPSPLRPINSQR